jgi:signal peptidase I
VNTFEVTLRELLASGQRARFRAEGDSMYPTIRSGDMVEIAPCEADSLRPGDIVLAMTRRGLTLHRIARISNAGIVIRGDNAISSDAPVAPEDILGKMVEGKPGRNGWRRDWKSVKIIFVAAAFVRRLRSRLRRPYGL